MRYNSNKSNRPTIGNELPYSGQPGNPKINKQLKQLEEDINNVAGRLNGYVGEDDSEINGMIGDALDGIHGDVNGVETTVANLIPRLDNLENTVGGFATELQTAKVTAMDADFHKVVAGKFLFKNPPALITGTNICKINNGSVVYATDGTNSVLVDYTDKDAWVAKAKVEDGEHFSIYSNGVLAFTQSGGWSVYVIGNDFDTDDLSIPQVMVESSEDTPSYVNETPVNIETGVTIGGTLYAALARDYTFDSIEVTSATINSATVNVLNATSASIDAITTDNVIAQDAVVTDANIEHLNNSERNFKGYVDVDTHHGVDNIYIKLNKFTGTYYLKLINGSETMFTATVIWNGTNPVVNYYENTSVIDRDCLYKIILTDVGLYFVTNSSGNLYYGWDSFDAVTPESSYYIDEDETEICDYLVKYASRTVFLGNHSAASGMDVLGEVRADYISQTDDKPGFDFRGNATLSTLPLAVEVGAGAVYNITEDGYTDARFVEGAGKPINAGDDVIAVEADMPIEYLDVDGTNWIRYQGSGDITFVSSTGRLFNFTLNSRRYSDDNGVTWTNADFGEITNVSYNYDMFETSTGTLLFSSCKGNYKYIFRSTDNGATWTGTFFDDAYTKITFFEDSRHHIWISPYIYYIAGGIISPHVRVSTDDGATFSVPNNLYATGQFEFFETDTGRLFITGLYRHFVPGQGTRDTFGMFYTDDFENYTRCNFPSGKIPFSMIDSVYSSGGIGVFRLYQFDGRLITSKPILDNTDDFASYLYYSDDNGETWSEVQCLNNMIINNSNYDQNFYCTGDVVKVQGRLVTFSTTQRRDPETGQYYWQIRFAYSLNNGATWIAYSDTYTRFNSDITKLFVASDDKRLMILGPNVKYSDDAGKTINDTDFNTEYTSGSNYFDMYEKDKVLYFGQGYSEPNTRHDIVHTIAWDKFSAGVNYENFVAQNIKATGNLEVDGTSQFDDDVTVNADLNADKVITPDLEVTGAMTANSTGIAFTKNVTHTGNYTQTGNQTVSGGSTLNNVTANTVIIGDLD